MNGPTAFILGLFFVVGLAVQPAITLGVLAVGVLYWKVLR